MATLEPPDDLQKLFHTLQLVNCDFVNAIYTISLTSLQGSRSPTGSAPSVVRSALPVGTTVLIEIFSVLFDDSDPLAIRLHYPLRSSAESYPPI